MGGVFLGGGNFHEGEFLWWGIFLGENPTHNHGAGANLNGFSLMLKQDLVKHVEGEEALNPTHNHGAGALLPYATRVSALETLVS